jgi:serpin B
MAAGLAFSSCSHRTGDRPLTDSARAIARASNAFTLDLYRQVAALDSSNLALSGFSVHAALTMTYLGAKGETADEMRKVLHLDSLRGIEAASYGPLQDALQRASGKKTHEFALANALWTDDDHPLRQSFRNTMARGFNAEGQSVSFANHSSCEKARQKINRWAEKKTHGMIQNLLKPGDLDGETILVLSNALYFHGQWAVPFSPGKTNRRPFFKMDSTEISVTMMHLKSAPDGIVMNTGKNSAGKAGEFYPAPVPHVFTGLQNDSLQILNLPYRESRASMVILLPTRYNGLPDLEKRLNETLLESLLQKLDTLNSFSIALPKFTLDTHSRLVPVLDSLGIHKAFRDADFSEMYEDGSGFIKDVIHGAKIEIDEQGTTAAAATHVLPIRGNFPGDFDFRADHPFLFLIRDHTTGTILFMGRVLYPAG